jgi:hypothetical protein
MLFFEPVEDREAIPVEISPIVEALARKGFKNGHIDEDLELINLGRLHPLIEQGGKFIYDGLVVGYLRALKNS